MPLDADDIADLYARHARQLVVYFARRTYDAEAAGELMAETFAAVVADRRRFRGRDEEAAAAWLYSIARNRLSDWMRRARVERNALARLGLDPPQLSDVELERIVELAGTAELRARVADRLEELAPVHRVVLQLRVVQERSYEDIAARLGVSEQTVRARVSRALRALGNAVLEAQAGHRA